MIDTHAHLDKKTCLKNINKIINISLNLNFAQKHKKIFNAIGYHPHDIKKFNLQKLKKLAKNKKVVAIGEIGLDKTAKADFKKQKEVFLKQFNLAQKLNLPVILHVRDYHKEMLEILPEKVNGVVHCFSSSLQNAQKYLAKNLFLSFTGIITYSGSYDKVVLNTPLDKILLETDCPFLAPAPFRGKKCEPWMVKFTAQKIAKIKNISLIKVITQTTKNTEKLFKISR